MEFLGGILRAWTNRLLEGQKPPVDGTEMPRRAGFVRQMPLSRTFCPSVASAQFFVFVCLLELTACAGVPPPPTHVASRDSRSQAYCFIRAGSAGYADYDAAAACRRAEFAAEVRAKITHIDSDLDRACEDEASFGQLGGPFSWRAYMRCVDDSI
jgi:hypothetical protein